MGYEVYKHPHEVFGPQTSKDSEQSFPYLPAYDISIIALFVSAPLEEWFYPHIYHYLLSVPPESQPFHCDHVSSA